MKRSIKKRKLSLDKRLKKESSLDEPQFVIESDEHDSDTVELLETEYLFNAIAFKAPTKSMAFENILKEKIDDSWRIKWKALDAVQDYPKHDIPVNSVINDITDHEIQLEELVSNSLSNLGLFLHKNTSRLIPMRSAETQEQFNDIVSYISSSNSELIQNYWNIIIMIIKKEKFCFLLKDVFSLFYQHLNDEIIKSRVSIWIINLLFTPLSDSLLYAIKCAITPTLSFALLPSCLLKSLKKHEQSDSCSIKQICTYLECITNIQNIDELSIVFIVLSLLMDPLCIVFPYRESLGNIIDKIVTTWNLDHIKTMAFNIWSLLKEYNMITLAFIPYLPRNENMNMLVFNIMDIAMRDNTINAIIWKSDNTEMNTWKILSDSLANLVEILNHCNIDIYTEADMICRLYTNAWWIKYMIITNIDDLINKEHSNTLISLMQDIIYSIRPKPIKELLDAQSMLSLCITMLSSFSTKHYT